MLAFLSNGGATGALIHAHDWTAHPLGPIASWPAALRTALGIVLGSSFPTFLAWGSGFHLFYNDAYVPMLGNKAHESLGRPLPDVWAEVWDSVGPYAQRVLEGESFMFEDYPTTLERHGYREQAWFTFSYSPVRDDEGIVRGVLCTVIEVTEKLRALARHKEAEEHLALSLEASGNIGTWSYDLDTAATYVDERFARLFQVEAALAREGTELTRFTDMIHPDDRPAVLEAIDRAILTETRYDIEYRIPQRSGLDVWVNARGKVFVNPETGGRRFAGVAVDITERKRAEQARSESERQAVLAERAMQESEAKFRLIADVIPQLVWSADALGRSDYLNARWTEFTGVPTAHIADGGWHDVIHPDDLPGLIAAWQHSFTTGAPYEIEHRLIHRSGEYRWMLNRALASRDAAGKPAHWMGTLTDIHDKKTGEDELRAQARRKDEFLAMLAHELRNPLAPISNAAQLLSMAALDPQRVRQSSEVIIRQVRHMTSLVDDLLDVSRVTRGLVELERERVDIKSVLASAVEQARPLIERRGHALDQHLAPGRCWVYGDRIRLVQVIVNLLNNAAKYTAQGGSIALSIETDADGVAIAVRDNGIGIDRAMLPHVFGLFTQAERTPDRSQGGLGLGLALVHSLVQLHGGRVAAHSEGLGKGSTFTVTLPTVDAGPNAASATAEARMAAPARAGAGRRILVVDDNVDAALSLAEVLRSLGHSVATAHDSHDALKQAGVDWPDVFILDIGLPDIDGYALARHLHQDADGRGATLIALTGYGQAHDRVLAKTAGFDHHFVKPVDLGALVGVIERASTEHAPRRDRP